MTVEQLTIHILMIFLQNLHLEFTCKASSVRYLHFFTASLNDLFESKVKTLNPYQ